MREESDPDMTMQSLFADWEFGYGFGSEIWPCFKEFLNCEYQEIQAGEKHAKRKTTGQHRDRPNGITGIQIRAVVNSNGIKRAENSLLVLGIEADEAEIVLQAVGYTLFGAEFYPQTDQQLIIETTINKECLRRSAQCLLDNGIPEETVNSALMILCQALLPELSLEICQVLGIS